MIGQSNFTAFPVNTAQRHSPSPLHGRWPLGRGKAKPLLNLSLVQRQLRLKANAVVNLGLPRPKDEVKTLPLHSDSAQSQSLDTQSACRKCKNTLSQH